MKVVILAGGLGTRLSEETVVKPKPMVDIGSRPIIWHIMKFYAAQGFNEFIVCLGYKGYQIKEYFMNYFIHSSDVTINLKTNEIEWHHCASEPWTVTLIDTGAQTQTGGRLAKVKKYIGNETFMMTYGDGLSDVNLHELVRKHNRYPKTVATVTAVQPLGRFGAIDMDASGLVTSFFEKPKGDGGWINGGFFVLEPSIFDFIHNDLEPFEDAPLIRVTRKEALYAYQHRGFWHPMDTLRDKTYLNQLWDAHEAPWKVWD